MEQNKLGQEPAFHSEVQVNLECKISNKQTSNFTILDFGMSKRFYAACAAMQGLLSQHIKPNKGDAFNWEFEPAYKSRFLTNIDDNDNQELVRDAYMIADELLKQETE